MSKRIQYENRMIKEAAMNQDERRKWLLQELIKELPEGHGIELPECGEVQKWLLRALLNIRLPLEISDEFLRVQDEYLQAELAEKGITDYRTLSMIEEGIYLWRGDITTLRCDGIVNAANSRMMGCFQPNHGCIDNAIHTFAGVQLRAACAELMFSQGHEEPAGKAKITPAFNLPCQYVLHTVGPVVSGSLTRQDCELLESCYRSCLELAAQNGLRSLAFCCISTGEFHFPHERAAEIAVRTVREFIKGRKMEVIFNVFKEEDDRIYRSLLG